MNAFVKKEVRLLLPNFGFACVLALAGIFFPNNPDNLLNSITYFLSSIFCPAVAAMLALSSFGVEVSSGTFSNLLAQPVSRLKIWETKIVFLSVAMVVLGFLWLASFLFSAFHAGQDHGIKDWLDLLSIVIVTGLVIFSGGLWTVLLLRQVAAAFWFTLLVPGVLLMIVIALCGGESDEFITGMSATVLGLYSLAGFFFARWLFLRAQDLQWSGGTIVMPELRGLARFKSVAAELRVWRPRAALWRKEFMLHQSQYVMAFVLLVLHLGVLAVPHFYDLSKSRDLKFVLETFWGLWLVMPLLVGCAAVAEERKIGTLEGQLCLPVKRRTQFAIKIIVVLLLSVLLGAVMPLLLEGARIFSPEHKQGFDLSEAFAVLFTDTSALAAYHMSVAQLLFWKCLAFAICLLPLLALVGVAVLIGGVSFYVSSLARNTLQSLAPATLGVLLMGFLLVAAGIPQIHDFDFMWRGPLAYFIAVPLVLLMLVLLAYGNFQQVRTDLRLCGRNLLAFVLALVLGVAATSAVYHRGWEKFTTFEPTHGAARLTLADAVTVENKWRELSVRLPGGKFWVAQYDRQRPHPVDELLGSFKINFRPGTFVADSNWITVTRGNWYQKIGLKADGTLWVSPKPVHPAKLEPGRLQLPKPEVLARFGSETNWSSLAWIGELVWLTKHDGTLWRWGVTNFNWNHDTWPGLQALTPHRLGMESNWTEVFGSDGRFFLRKNDGSIWSWWNEFERTKNLDLIELEPGCTVASWTKFAREKYRSTAQINHGLQYKVGVRDDGTFRIWSDLRVVNSTKHHYGEYQWFPTDLQIGHETNWLAVSGGYGEKLIMLKKDGTLWLWNFHRSDFGHWNDNEFEPEIQRTVPIRLGSHADWLAISSSTALAADGSVWYWPLENSEVYYGDRNDTKGIHPLLDVSHKPQLLGNVFAAGQ